MPIHPREISSNDDGEVTRSAARPPYASGTVMPKRPSAFIPSTISVG